MDTNVVIDFLANRQPFSQDAARLFDLAVNKKVEIYISAISYGNIYYVMRKSLSNKDTVRLLEELAEITHVADVTTAVIHKSFKSEFNDYEDSIQYYCALSIPKIDFIVTRNTKDFKKSNLPVLTTAEAVGLLNVAQ